jgi:hypothetical protein
MPALVTSVMNGGDPISPTSNQRMTKAAFFRARSPPVPEKDAPINNLASRFDMSTRLQPEYQGDNSVDSHTQNNGRFMGTNNNGYPPSIGTLGHTPPLDRGLARNPTISSDGPLSPDSNGPALRGGYGGNNTGSDGTAYEEEDYEGTKESGMTGGGSDEMLMSLLAGQAALDCETLPISRWEEVESWKKVRLFITSQADGTGIKPNVKPLIITRLTPSERNQDPDRCPNTTKAQQQQ